MEAPSRLLVSHPSPDGSVVICAVSPASVVRAEFVDEEGWRDITDLVPDLLLIGLAEAGHASSAGAQEDLVGVGRVYAVGGEPELLFASPAGQVVRPVTFVEALPFIEAAIAAQITAGVAAEAAEVVGAPPSGSSEDAPATAAPEELQEFPAQPSPGPAGDLEAPGEGPRDGS